MAAAEMNPRVTLRDVAKAAGVGLATASRAMRDDPATTEATREKVKRVAEQIGYRPDPGMSHLIERRWHGKRKRAGMNIGYLYNGASALGSMSRFQLKKFGSVAEAKGYALLEQDISQFPTAQKLLKRLWVQGVEGLLISLLPDVPYDLDSVFKKFPAVSINVSSYRPSCPIIMHDEFNAISELWQHLQSQGYERIGVLLEDYPNSVTTDLRMGSILNRRSLQRPQKNRIPILYYHTKEYKFDDEFGKWVDKQQPDVVLADSHVVIDRIHALGYRIPQDFGFATFNFWDSKRIGQIAGYYRDNDGICSQGLDLLNIMIRTGRTGNQNAKMMEMVAGEWKEGESLPQKNTPSVKTG